MGGCTSREKEETSSFTKEEKSKLKATYQRLVSSENKAIDKNLFINHFRENTPFGARLFKFLKVYSHKKVIDYDLFQGIAEVLIKESFDEGYRKNEYSSFDKMEILALISLGKKKIKKKEELHEVEIVYLEAIQYIKDFMQMFNLERINYQIDEAAIISLLNNIFETNTMKMKWGSFLLKLKEQFMFLNNLIKNYFAYKFLDNSPVLKIAKLSQPSYLLNKESLSLLYLSNSFMQTAKSLKCLYSCTGKNWDFDKLYDILINYKGSTILLFRHEEILDFAYEKTSSQKNYVFGVFQYMAWGDINQNARGTEETYIFSLKPSFCNFFSKKNYDNNYGKRFSVIANMRDKNAFGIGFGKNQDGTFRLWIDKDLNTNSYAVSKDEVYENGHIVDPYIQKFNINLVEVWGLENSKELNYHHVLGYTNFGMQENKEKSYEFAINTPQKRNLEVDIKRYMESQQN